MKKIKKNKFTFLAFVILLIFMTNSGVTSLNPSTKKQLKYRTSFGKCPSRTAGTLTLKLIKVFEENASLKDVKRKMVDERLAERHFISDYRISFDPIKKFLNFKFDCPEPLMKVQIYKENGLDSYEAILVGNGRLYDPTYEVVLRSEHKLTNPLPFLAIPVGEMEESVQKEITELIHKMGGKFRKKLSEIILSEKGELTVILSVKGNPSSVFLGTEEWDGKVVKLKQIVKFMETKGRIPAIINLTNSKKVVVKFNDKF